MFQKKFYMKSVKDFYQAKYNTQDAQDVTHQSCWITKKLLR